MIDVFIVFMVVVFSVWVIYTVLSLAPWFPTRKRDIERIGRLAELEKGQVFCDLGSGDGRVIVPLARLYPESMFIGIEMSFVLHILAKIRLKMSGASNVHLIRGNVYAQGYSDVDVVYVFGTERTLNNSFKERIVPLLPAGSKILSYNFCFKAWDGEVIKDQPEGFAPVYVYEIS